MKQTIIRKLTSRKLWAAIVGFITPLMLAFGNTNNSTYIAGQNMRLYSQSGISYLYVDNIYVATNYDSPRSYKSLKEYIKGVVAGTI